MIIDPANPPEYKYQNSCFFGSFLIRGRVAPILKEQIDGGKINLTAIVNTHQFVFPTAPVRELADILVSHWDHAGGNSKIVG